MVAVAGISAFPHDEDAEQLFAPEEGAIILHLIIAGRIFYPPKVRFSLLPSETEKMGNLERGSEFLLPPPIRLANFLGFRRD